MRILVYFFLLVSEITLEFKMLSRPSFKKNDFLVLKLRSILTNGITCDFGNLV